MTPNTEKRQSFDTTGIVFGGNVRCGDCEHYRRLYGRPHLGGCAAGEIEAIVGNWDTDLRSCPSFTTTPRRQT